MTRMSIIDVQYIRLQLYLFSKSRSRCNSINIVGVVWCRLNSGWENLVAMFWRNDAFAPIRRDRTRDITRGAINRRVKGWKAISVPLHLPPRKTIPTKGNRRSAASVGRESRCKRYTRIHNKRTWSSTSRVLREEGNPRGASFAGKGTSERAPLKFHDYLAPELVVKKKLNPSIRPPSHLSSPAPSSSSSFTSPRVTTLRSLGAWRGTVTLPWDAPCVYDGSLRGRVTLRETANLIKSAASFYASAKTRNALALTRPLESNKFPCMCANVSKVAVKLASQAEASLKGPYSKIRGNGKYVSLIKARSGRINWKTSYTCIIIRQCLEFCASRVFIFRSRLC